jgi:hypothetical protein
MPDARGDAMLMPSSIIIGYVFFIEGARRYTYYHDVQDVRGIRNQCKAPRTLLGPSRIQHPAATIAHV